MKQEEGMSGLDILSRLNRSLDHRLFVSIASIIDVEPFTWSLGRSALLSDIEIEEL